MRSRANWWMLYLFTAAAVASLVWIRPGDTSGYILWIIGTYGGMWVWLQNNRAAMVQSPHTYQSTKKKIVNVRYESYSGEKRRL